MGINRIKQFSSEVYPLDEDLYQQIRTDMFHTLKNGRDRDIKQYFPNGNSLEFASDIKQTNSTEIDEMANTKRPHLKPADASHSAVLGFYKTLVAADYMMEQGYKSPAGRQLQDSALKLATLDKGLSQNGKSSALTPEIAMQASRSIERNMDKDGYYAKVLPHVAASLSSLTPKSDTPNVNRALWFQDARRDSTQRLQRHINDLVDTGQADKDLTQFGRDMGFIDTGIPYKAYNTLKGQTERLMRGAQSQNSGQIEKAISNLGRLGQQMGELESQHKTDPGTPSYAQRIDKILQSSEDHFRKQGQAGLADVMKQGRESFRNGVKSSRHEIETEGGEGGAGGMPNLKPSMLFRTRCQKGLGATDQLQNYLRAMSQTTQDIILGAKSNDGLSSKSQSVTSQKLLETRLSSHEEKTPHRDSKDMDTPKLTPKPFFGFSR